MRDFYLKWIAANSIAEFVGLGATFALVASTWAAIDRAPLWLALLLALAVAAVGAAVEGTVVGTLQWAVLRSMLPALSRWRWVAMTALGALLAWGLGMLPSTLLGSTAAQGNGAAMSEPPIAVQLLLAAGMGLVLGPFLGVPQWAALRRHLPRAGAWVPANMLAWSLGMPTIFAAMSFVGDTTPTVVVVGVLGVSLLVAGAVVGAVHGAFLVSMLRAAGHPDPTEG